MNLTVLYCFLCLLAFVSFSLVYVQRTLFLLSSPFHSFLFEKPCSSLSQSLLYYLLCLLVRFRSRLFFSFMFKGSSWSLSKSLLYCFLCMLAPLSSSFLLYVQRKVLGACQNRLLVTLYSPFHSFLFEKHSCQLSQSLLYCLYSLSAGSSLVSFSPLVSTLLEESSWRLSESLLYCIIFYLVSFSLIYRQWNVLCDCLNLLR
jgi:hypothetical protein